MPDKTEKARRKQIQKELQQKAQAEFEKSLPISRVLFQKQFDFLDEEFEKNDCDDSLKMTKQFLESQHIQNILIPKRMQSLFSMFYTPFTNLKIKTLNSTVRTKLQKNSIKTIRITK